MKEVLKVRNFSRGFYFREENNTLSKWRNRLLIQVNHILLDFSLTVKAATSIFISGCGSAISSAKSG